MKSCWNRIVAFLLICSILMPAVAAPANAVGIPDGTTDDSSMDTAFTDESGSGEADTAEDAGLSNISWAEWMAESIRLSPLMTSAVPTGGDMTPSQAFQAALNGGYDVGVLTNYSVANDIVDQGWDENGYGPDDVQRAFTVTKDSTYRISRMYDLSWTDPSTYTQKYDVTGGVFFINSGTFTVKSTSSSNYSNGFRYSDTVFVVNGGNLVLEGIGFTGIKTVVQLRKGSVTFKDCHFLNCDSVVTPVAGYGNASVTFDDCTFSSTKEMVSTLNSSLAGGSNSSLTINMDYLPTGVTGSLYVTGSSKHTATLNFGGDRAGSVTPSVTDSKSTILVSGSKASIVLSDKAYVNANSNGYAIELNNGASLKATGSGVNISGKNAAAIYASGGSTVEIDGAHVTGTPAVSLSGSKLIIQDAPSTPDTGTYAIADGESSIEMNDGEMSFRSTAFDVKNGSVKIAGGTISDNDNFIRLRKGSVAISGGEFSYNTDVVAIESGNGACTVDITGGSFYYDERIVGRPKYTSSTGKTSTPITIAFSGATVTNPERAFELVTDGTCKAEMTMSGGTIDSSNYAAITMEGASKLTFSGGSIENSSNDAVSAENGAVIVMTDGTISNSTGAAVALSSESEMTFSGGSLIDGQSTAVLVNNGSEFTMSGGVISGNEADYYAGGISSDMGVVTISGGEIKDNFGFVAGGVYLSGNHSVTKGYTSSLTITGGTISGNEANGNYAGGGVMVNDDTTPKRNAFTISGNPVISGNINIDGASNIYTPQGVYINIGGSLSGAKLGYMTGGTLPSVFTKGWSKAGVAEGSISSVFSSDHGHGIRLTDGELELCESDANRFTVTFNPNGGNCDVASEQTAADGTIWALPDAYRDGYSFAGWFTAASGGQEVTSSTVFTQDTTVYAQYSRDAYTIKFDGNGGTPSVSSKATGTTAATMGKLTNLPTATRSGYTFAGWFTEKTGGAQITESTVFTGNDTVYAHWLSGSSGGSVGNYTVTFDPTYGRCDIESLPVNSSNKLSTIPVPSRSGYAFMGWSTSQYGTGTIIDEDYVFTKDTTVYAKWDTWRCNITFKANGGICGMQSTVTSSYNIGCVDKFPTPTHSSGAKFIGWYTMATGGEKVDTSTVFRVDTTLYAHYSGDFTITFDANGGTSSTSMMRTSSENFGRLDSLPTATCPGYTFTGWYTASYGGSKVTETYQFQGDATVYAHWDVGVYTVTFNANGGIPEYGSDTTSSSSSYRGQLLELPTASKPGYAFVGWFTEKTGGTMIKAKNYVFTGDTTVYAQWSKTYTVTFNASGGYCNVSMLDTTAEGYLKSLPYASKAGYAFDGWYDSSSGGIQVVANSYRFTTNATVYARFTKVPTYRITFNATANGGTCTPTSMTTSTSQKGYLDPSYWPTGVKTGHTFLGWFTKATDDGTKVTGSYFTTDTTLYAHFEENTYTISYTLNGGSYDGKNPNPTTYRSVDESILLENPTRPGYEFKGWTGTDIDPDEPQTRVVIAKGSEGNRTYTAVWALSNEVPYRVEYYQQLPDGSGYKLHQTVLYYGTTDARVFATKLDYAGFTENTYHPNRLAVGKIEADGSLVMRLYYDRQDVQVTVNLDDGSSPKVYQGNYGASLSQILGDAVTPEKYGYTFGGWDAGDAGTLWGDAIVVEDLILHPIWTSANTSIYYRVEHYTEIETGDSYVLYETEDKQGYVGAMGTASPKSYPGFTYNPSAPGQVLSGMIVADGSLTLKLYYDREIVHFTTDPNNGTQAVTQELPYGVTVSRPADPTNAGQDFGGWYRDNSDVKFDFTLPIIADTTAKAKWVDSAYVVEYYQQQLDGSYQLYESFNMTGTPGSSVEAEVIDYTGFILNQSHPNRKPSGIVGTDDTLRVYYDRIEHRVTADPGNGDGEYTSYIKHGALYTPPADPMRSGYVFNGWVDADGHYFDASRPITGEVSLSAKWTPGDAVPYEIRHYQQNVDGTDYTLVKTEEKFAIANAPVTAQSMYYTGFTPRLNSAPGIDVHPYDTVKGDGSTVLTCYYDRQIMTVDIDPDNGEEIQEQSVRYGALAEEPLEPEKTGYTFAGWHDSNNNVFDFALAIENDTTVIASYETRGDMPYTVEHYVQDADGEGYSLRDTDQLTGAYGETVYAIPKAYDGCVEDVENLLRKDSGEIGETDNLVLKLYYNRGIISLTVYLNDAGASVTQELLYGAIPQEPEQVTAVDGYAFSHWEDADGYRFDFSQPLEKNTVVYARFAPLSDVSYKVERYFEQTDGTFVINSSETETFTGTVGETVNATVKLYEGYVYSPMHPGSASSGTVLADGSLVLKLYYAKTDLTVTVDNGDDSPYQTYQVKYGSLITPPVTPSRTGYVFAGWTDAAGAAFDFQQPIVKDTMVRAAWTAADGVAYSVQYYLQNVTGDGYTLQETEMLTGTTGDAVTAPEKSFDGFVENTTHGDRVISGEIIGGRFLTLKRYYDRQMLTVTLDPDNGEAKQTMTVRYGNRIAQPDDPYKDGYDFGGWVEQSNRRVALESAFNFGSVVTRDLNLIANWIEHGSVAYKVEYYVEVLGGEYALQETETFHGAYGDQVTIPSKAFDGYKENLTHPDRVVTAILPADDSLVLKRYYDLDNKKIPVIVGDDKFEVDYGSKIPRPEDPTRPGYDFDGWVDESTGEDFDFDTPITGPVVIIPTWTPRDDTPYKVEHWRSLDGQTYELFETESLQGTTDTQATAKPKSYDGYVENTSHAGRVVSGNIDGLGTLVLKLYYDYSEATYRVEHWRSLDGRTYELFEAETLTGTIGEIATASANRYTGYEENRSHPNRIASGMVTRDNGLVLKLYYDCYLASYTVEHYTQDLDGEDYTLYDKEVFTGDINEFVRAKALVMRGFDENTSHEDRLVSGTVSADGSLVLRLYYDRRMMTIIAHPDNGEDAVKYKVPYGGVLDDIDIPEKSGYTFLNWLDEDGKTVDLSKPIEKNLDIYARWISISADGNGSGDEIIIDPNMPTGVPNTGLQDSSALWLRLSVLFLVLTISSGAYIVIDGRRVKRRR